PRSATPPWMRILSTSLHFSPRPPPRPPPPPALHCGNDRGNGRTPEPPTPSGSPLPPPAMVGREAERRGFYKTGRGGHKGMESGGRGRLEERSRLGQRGSTPWTTRSTPP